MSDDRVFDVDAHLHLWDRSRFDYPWMSGLGLPESSLPTDELHQAWDGGAVADAIVIEAGATPEQWDDEVDWAAQLAADHPFLAGMVAAVGFTAADLTERLERYSRHTFVRGVRDNFEDREPGWLDTTDNRAGVIAARRAGMTVDLCVRGDQLDELLGLVRTIAESCGDGSGLVLDHLGKPAVGAGADTADLWASGMARLAAVPGLCVKVSGLGGQLDGQVSSADLAKTVRAYAVPAVEAFGPQRALIGSDHPVSTVPRGTTRRSWWSTVRSTLETVWGAEAVAPILGANARAFYGVK